MSRGPTAPTASAEILLIDDGDEGRDALTQLLRLDGHAVVSAATGLLGMAAARLARFDAVIVDYGLPDVDALEIIRAFRFHVPPPVIIVFSGYHRMERPSVEAGCDAFVLKPDLDALLTQLKTLLASRRAAHAPTIRATQPTLVRKANGRD